MCSFKCNKNDKMSLWRENRNIVSFHPLLIYPCGNCRIILYSASLPFPCLSNQRATCSCFRESLVFVLSRMGNFKGLFYVQDTLYVLKADFLKILLHSSWLVFWRSWIMTSHYRGFFSAIEASVTWHVNNVTHVSI